MHVCVCACIIMLHSKCKETTGLQLTRVQSVYWRAVQRRMVLGQLEEVIDHNLNVIHERDIRVPYELVASLVRCDPGNSVLICLIV